MNYPPEMKDYCKKCNKHTKHKVKEWKKSSRPFKRRHTRSYDEKRKKGYGARVPKTTSIKKQAKRFIAILTCADCKGKHYFKSDTRMKKAMIKK